MFKVLSCHFKITILSSLYHTFKNAYHCRHRLDNLIVRCLFDVISFPVFVLYGDAIVLCSKEAREAGLLDDDDDDDDQVAAYERERYFPTHDEPLYDDGL